MEDRRVRAQLQAGFSCQGPSATPWDQDGRVGTGKGGCERGRAVSTADQAALLESLADSF